MPIYEYECLACGRRTEALQRMTDPPLAACPECGGAVKKLISRPAFQFKGTGWYVTDYARAKPAAKSEKGDGAAPSADGGAGAAPGEGAPGTGAKGAGEGASAARQGEGAAGKATGSGAGTGASGK
jgi:putative FmdB family regulatory protein